MLDNIILTDGADITAWRCEGVANFTLGFVALDPNAYSYSPDGYSSEVTVNRSTTVAGGRVWTTSLASWKNGKKLWTGSGSSIVTVNVSTVLPVNPVIVVEGLATNITITNLSTNTSITYTGTVDANQTLVIDCYNQTAKLNGANVVSNISGDWIQIVNGVNRFQLSIGSGTTDHAVLKWNEVVG